MVQPVQRPFLALFLRLLATGVLATLIMLVKYTSETGVAFAEILFWRQVPSGILILGWLALRGEVARLRTNRLPTHARRAMLGLLGNEAKVPVIARDGALYLGPFKVTDLPPLY